MPIKKVKRFMFRIPVEEHEELVEWAKAEGRSLQSHLWVIVKQALANHRRREARRKEVSDD